MPNSGLPPSASSPRTRRSSSVWDYEQSLMFGRYREHLATFALNESRKLKQLRGDSSRKQKVNRKCSQRWSFSRGLRSFGRFGGDMLFFTTLAITLAILSFAMDCCVHEFLHLRHFLTHFTDSFALNYLFWVLYMLCLVLISAIVTRVFSPQAAGSGVAEMKVILRGVVLKEYLSLKTLLTKLVGETFTLASGIYLGKEGPFVHISSMVANQFMKLFYSTTDSQQYEARFLEVIAVACGLGVAVSFASPVGGVLYSIEIVSVFFSVRSYWHGFFAATIGALFWRLLTVWFGYQETITPLFETTFRYKNPYEALELLAFAFLGFLCGLAAYAYIELNRSFVIFNRRQNAVNTFLQRYPLLYPIIITLIVGLITFPGALGQFYTSWLTHDDAIRELFSNFTWYPLEGSPNASHIVEHWHTEHTSIFANTLLFSVMNILLITICTTLPIPGGVIVPSFKIGAGFGRFYGESMVYLLPAGIYPIFNRTEYPLQAGAYALVGSAAFAGANTGAMSSAMIALEMTGQLTFLMPAIVATLVATITARYFGPSIYDSLIILKKLPYLPAILPSSSIDGHQILVEDFMEKELQFVWTKCTYGHLKRILSAKPKLRFFPFVKSTKCMILLGTVERSELELLLETHLSQLGQPELRKSRLDLGDLKEEQAGKFHVSTIQEEEDGQATDQAAICKKECEDANLLEMHVDFHSCPIDPAPFQLTEGTSLIKTHNLFSLLGLQLAYVTSLGALVGVVSLQELGQAIENMNNNEPSTCNRVPDETGLDALIEQAEEEKSVGEGKRSGAKSVSIAMPKDGN